MIDWLLVARSNNYGLTRDAALIAEAIRASGQTVEFTETRQRGFIGWLLGSKRARNILHIERVFPRWYSAGEHNWLIPNQERFPKRHLSRLKRIDLVLAKTHHAEQVFAALGAPVSYAGFTSEDRYDPAVTKDWNRFFHLAGASTLKGTKDVLDLWAAHPEWPELVLVQKKENAPSVVPANVKLVSGYLDDAALKGLQNSCGVHLCPSRSEGWGHHILEGMSASAVVVTTDGPPMNEHVSEKCGILIPYGRSEERHLGTNYYVDTVRLEQAITGLIAMPDAEKARLGSAARARFLEIDGAFRDRAKALFSAAATL